MTIPQTRHVVDRYVTAWTTRDMTEISKIMRREVHLESNLGTPEAFLDQLTAIAEGATVSVVGRIDNGERSMIIYDCTAHEGGGMFRFVEYLDLQGDQITEIRRVYDLGGIYAALALNPRAT